MGNGYPVITRTLEPGGYTDGEGVSWSIWFLLLLMVGKMVATAVTLGSGGSG